MFFFVEVKRRNTSGNDDESNEIDDQELVREFLPKTSIGNGEIRQLRHSHQSNHTNRSRHVQPIVLIPEQSHSVSPVSTTTILANPCSHSQLFNSNMFLLERHLKHLIQKQKLEEDRNEIVNEWKLMAIIMDRLLFWLFTTFTLLSTILCLIIIPFLKNSGYIPALSKDLVNDFKSNENIANVIEQQLTTNATDILV